jgi:integrin-linked kinase-associated serine/threonine phosphatase 2C
MDLFDSLPPPKAPPAAENDQPFDNRATHKRVNMSHDDGDLSNDHETTSLPTKKPKRDCYQFKGYVGARQGERDEMQDAHVILDSMCHLFTPPPTQSISRMSYYGVFDGHSGAKASTFAAENLHKNIIEKFPNDFSQDNFDRTIKRCLIESFKKTDSDFLAIASKATPTLKDGSTAAILLIVDDVMYSGTVSTGCGLI